MSVFTTLNFYNIPKVGPPYEDSGKLTHCPSCPSDFLPVTGSLASKQPVGLSRQFCDPRARTPRLSRHPRNWSSGMQSYWVLVTEDQV